MNPTFLALPHVCVPIAACVLLSVVFGGCVIVSDAALDAPDAPGDVTATAGDSEVLVSWSAPFSGGHTIRGYAVRAVEDTTKGCEAVALTRCMVTGLAGGQPYTFTVRARNRIGAGPASAPSPPATPSSLPAFASVWTSRSVTTSNDLYAVVWTGTRVVAVGDFGSLATSPDGLAWTNHGSDFQSSGPYLRDVAYNGVRLVAVGLGGRIYTSSSGTAWTLRSSGIFSHLQAVVWGGHASEGGAGVWLAAGDARTVLTSPDGITWTSRDIGNVPASDLNPWGYRTRFAVRTDSLFVLIPEYDEPILTSPDGVTWRRGTRFESMQFDAVTWTGAELVALGRDLGDGNREIVLRSPDGIRWTQMRMDIPVRATALVWTGTRFVTISADGMVSTSPDGELWTVRRPRQDLIVMRQHDLVWTGTRLVTVGSFGGILTSP